MTVCIFGVLRGAHSVEPPECPDQAGNKMEFDLSYSTGTTPRFGPNLNRWVAIRIYSSSDVNDASQANCYGLTQEGQYSHLLALQDFSVNIHRPEGSQRVVWDDDRSGPGMTFAFSMENRPVFHYRCRIQARQSRLLCRIEETGESIEYLPIQSLKVQPPPPIQPSQLDKSEVYKSQQAGIEIDAFYKALIVLGILIFTTVAAMLIKWLVKYE